jgi:hypothetical protein
MKRPLCSSTSATHTSMITYNVICQWNGNVLKSFSIVVLVFDDHHNCKKNGPRAIWLNRFWCLMINITCGLICLLVFVFVAHRMLKLLGPSHWGKQHLKRRHYDDQAKSKKKMKCCLQTVWSGAPNCPVPHAGLSGAPGTVAPTTSSRWHCGEKTTGLSGVTSGVFGVKILRSNGRLRCQTNG